MAKARTIYDDVFEIYELQKRDITFKKKIRSAVACKQPLSAASRAAFPGQSRPY